MKGVAAVLALIVGLSMAVSGAGSIKNMDLARDLHQASSPDSSSFESKLENALKDVQPARSMTSQEGNTEDSDNGDNRNNGTQTNSTTINGTTINGTMINGTSMNGTSINRTALNSTSLSSLAGAPALSSSPSSTAGVAGAEGTATISNEVSLSPDALGAEAKGSYNGFWSMDASKGGIGKAKIKSHTYLSGGFSVDKTVKFSDR